MSFVVVGGLRKAASMVALPPELYSAIANCWPSWYGNMSISRKYALALLEYFDATGLTRREGDARVLA